MSNSFFASVRNIGDCHDSDVSDAALQIADHVIGAGASALPKIAGGVQDLDVCSLVPASLRPRDYVVYVVRLRIESEFIMAIRGRTTPLLPFSNVYNHFERPSGCPVDRLNFP
jgi:hypothetical protein